MNAKTVLIYALLMLLFQPAQAEYFSDFRESDWILQSVFVGLACIDWAQTKKFRSEGKKETNPHLGSEPSQERVDTLIFAGIVGHTLVTWMLPQKYRELWIIPSIDIEIAAVWHNYNYGVRIGIGGVF